MWPSSSKISEIERHFPSFNTYIQTLCKNESDDFFKQITALKQAREKVKTDQTIIAVPLSLVLLSGICLVGFHVLQGTSVFTQSAGIIIGGVTIVLLRSFITDLIQQKRLATIVALAALNTLTQQQQQLEKVHLQHRKVKTQDLMRFLDHSSQIILAFAEGHFSKVEKIYSTYSTELKNTKVSHNLSALNAPLPDGNGLDQWMKCLDLCATTFCEIWETTRPDKAALVLEGLCSYSQKNRTFPYQKLVVWANEHRDLVATLRSEINQNHINFTKNMADLRAVFINSCAELINISSDLLNYFRDEHNGLNIQHLKALRKQLNKHHDTMMRKMAELRKQFHQDQIVLNDILTQSKQTGYVDDSPKNEHR